MNHQIIEHSNLMDHFHVRIILYKKKEDSSIRFSESFKAHKVELFHFSEYDNYYLTLKRFNTIINKSNGIIVSNDGIELHAIKLFGTSSLVYAIVHDFYNLKLALKNYNIVSVFMCHTDTYTKTLKSSGLDFPIIDYLPHGVKVYKDYEIKKVENNRPLKIIFIGRLIESKGVLFLYEIERGLKEKNIHVEWTIIGSGVLEYPLKEQWKNKTNVSFFAPSENKEVMGIASTCDLFVNPSVFEGYGIAILEAMSCHLVPLVYDLPIGIASLIPGEVGFRIEINNISGFITNIERLNNNRQLLFEMKKKAYDFVCSQYDIEHTSKKYLNSFLYGKNTIALQKSSIVKLNKNIKTFGLFDKWFLPNVVTCRLKKGRDWIRKII